MALGKWPGMALSRCGGAPAAAARSLTTGGSQPGGNKAPIHYAPQATDKSLRFHGNPPTYRRCRPYFPCHLYVHARNCNSRSGRFGDGLWGRLMFFLRAPYIDVNFDSKKWIKHKSEFKHQREWLPHRIMMSPTFRRVLFPDVFQVGVVSSLVCYYNSIEADKVMQILDTDGDGTVSTNELVEGIRNGLVEAHHVMGTNFFTTPEMVLLPEFAPFSLTGLALGMLLAFRIQNCNARYNEARALWGIMVNESRALTSRVLALCRGRGDTNALAGAGLLVKCVATFPITLKYHLTLDGFNPNINVTSEMSVAETEEMKTMHLSKELDAIWNSNESTERNILARVLDVNVSNRPLQVLHEISELTAAELGRPVQAGGVGLSDIHLTEIYRSVSRLQDVLGACERLYRTPIYTGYTTFTSRCVWLWTNLLPFALYPVMGPAGTIPTTMIVALFMYGIEDVGARIEQPFESLPLWQYCQTIVDSCNQLTANSSSRSKP